MQVVAEVDAAATINSLQQHQSAYLPVEQQLARLEGLCAQTVLPLCYAEYKDLYRCALVLPRRSVAAERCHLVMHTSADSTIHTWGQPQYEMHQVEQILAAHTAVHESAAQFCTWWIPSA